MKTIALTGILALVLAMSAGASTYVIGFEDWTDFDYNDTVIMVSSITMVETGVWVRPTVNAETPFPEAQGHYFTHAIATGDGIGTFLFQQTAAQNETAYIKVGVGGLWIPILENMPAQLQAAPGMPVFFKLQVGSQAFYPDAQENGDHNNRAVEAMLAPEPSTGVLVGLVCIGIHLALKRRRRR